MQTVPDIRGRDLAPPETWVNAETWYVCGPMRGIPLYNFPAFDAAARLLRGRGVWAINPAELDRRVGVTEHTDPLPDGFMAAAMQRDLHAITAQRTTGVALLPGWERSEGAVTEIAVARACGKKIAYINPDLNYFGPMPHRLVVGVCGHGRAGKDVAADGLERLGWARAAFSDAIMRVGEHVGWNGQKDTEGRRFLIRLGLAVREHGDVATWIRAVERAADATERHFVVTGVRYLEEAEWVRSRGGFLVRIDRPGVTAIDDADTEQHLEELNPEFTLVNDKSHEHLRTAMATLCAR